VAKTPVGDRLIRALETIDKLQAVAVKHTELLNQLVVKQNETDKRLAVIEKAAKR
jgi:hypothetical protein